VVAFIPIHGKALTDSNRQHEPRTQSPKPKEPIFARTTLVGDRDSAMKALWHTRFLHTTFGICVILAVLADSKPLLPSILGFSDHPHTMEVTGSSAVLATRPLAIVSRNFRPSVQPSVSKPAAVADVLRHPHARSRLLLASGAGDRTRVVLGRVGPTTPTRATPRTRREPTGDHARPTSRQTVKDDGAKPGVNLLARSKRREAS